MAQAADNRALAAMVRSERVRALSLGNDVLSRRAHASLRAARQRRGAWRRRMGAMYSDIDEARAQHAAIKQIVERHAGKAADYRALRRVLELCRRAVVAVEDRYCREKMRLVEDFAAELFSQAAMREAFLKREILNALELFHSRLYSLETGRRKNRLPEAALRAGAFRP